MSYWIRNWRRSPIRSRQGFTLIEVFVVLIIIGVLAAIAAPSWVRFYATQEVTTARDELRQGFLQAQNAAITHRAPWRFSLRRADEHLEWKIHPDQVDAEATAGWKALSPNVVLDLNDTTLRHQNGVYYVRFGFRGDVECCLGTVTLDSQNGIASNRCVVISTLIGATRNGEEHPYPNGDRYCY